MTMKWTEVEGFFDSDLVYKLATKVFSDGSTFVEVGSWMGKSTCCLGQLIRDSKKDIKIYAVDTFEGSEEHAPLLKELKDHSTSLFELFGRYTNLCKVNDIITPIKDFSVNAASKFKDESIDFIFLDASHDYESVLADINAWYPKLKPGGLIAGDDYAGCWPGVIKAVHEYFSDKPVFFLNGNLKYEYDQKVWHWCHFKKPHEDKKMNVTLYAICKNEEKNVERFIENSKKFSHTVVVDTGSTDNTVQLLRDAGITVYEHPQKRNEFDFSVARNQALSYVETDWAFSLDFNEEVSDISLDGLEEFADEITTFKHQRFDKSAEDSEPVESNSVHTRFHRKECYTWVYAVHEQPEFVPTEKYPKELEIQTTFKITKIFQDTVDKQLFYLSIAEREFEKNPNIEYYLWYIFLHYYKVNNFDQSIKYGQEYLTISKAYFDPIRIDIFILCSQMLLNLNNHQLSANYAFHAVSEAMNLAIIQKKQDQLYDDYFNRSLIHLFNVGKILNSSDIIVFASAFSPKIKRAQERTNAIDKLFLTNLDDIPSTAWGEHSGFAQWIVSYLRPDVIVDLGVDWGFSTFSFALPRIGKVYGVDTFEGDSFTHKFEDKSKYNFGTYEFVEMKREKLHLTDCLEFVKGTFDEVAETWNKKIDILHIDGSHHYEDVKKDFETWSKFLNDDSVILMHDTCVEKIDDVEYGVKKFFEEIDLPKCNFTNGWGLGVISKNKNLIQKIKKEFNLE